MMRWKKAKRRKNEERSNKKAKCRMKKAKRRRKKEEGGKKTWRRKNRKSNNSEIAFGHEILVVFFFSRFSQSEVVEILERVPIDKPLLSMDRCHILGHIDCVCVKRHLKASPRIYHSHHFDISKDIYQQRTYADVQVCRIICFDAFSKTDIRRKRKITYCSAIVHTLQGSVLVIIDGIASVAVNDDIFFDELENKYFLVRRKVKLCVLYVLLHFLTRHKFLKDIDNDYHDLIHYTKEHVPEIFDTNLDTPCISKCVNCICHLTRQSGKDAYSAVSVSRIVRCVDPPNARGHHSSRSWSRFLSSPHPQATAILSRHSRFPSPPRQHAGERNDQESGVRHLVYEYGPKIFELFHLFEDSESDVEKKTKSDKLMLEAHSYMVVTYEEELRTGKVLEVKNNGAVVSCTYVTELHHAAPFWTNTIEMIMNIEMGSGTVIMQSSGKTPG
ncbi:hypothetical protein ANN_15489 [Periplaneta americana]|uniref:Uncharacterized protein n=1 Tax=Periplaneta americana TaxID=6978 RepID=A0ABQ8SHD6_PERAM|nr:hypothetical protein ANN_15489 [Periplaneta americana]